MEPTQQKPFRLADAYKHPTLVESISEAAERMVERWADWESLALVSELVTAAASGGVGFADVAAAPGIPFGDPATPVWNALAVLEAELAERIGQRVGFIFLPPGLLAQAIGSYGLTREGDTWRTPCGNVVVVDGGFCDVAPPTGELASGAGEDWVYASGEVFYASASLPLKSDNPDIVRNMAHLFEQQVGILLFDVGSVTAVLASYSLEG